MAAARGAVTRVVSVWLLAVPAVLVSVGMVLVGFGWLGPFVWFALLGWAVVGPLLCTRRVRARAATGRVRFSRPSDLALLWLTAPWVASWHLLAKLAGRVLFAEASFAVAGVGVGVATVMAAQAGAVVPAVLLAMLGYLTMLYPVLNRRLRGPSLF